MKSSVFLIYNFYFVLLITSSTHTNMRIIYEINIHNFFVVKHTYIVVELLNFNYSLQSEYERGKLRDICCVFLSNNISLS